MTSEPATGGCAGRELRELAATALAHRGVAHALLGELACDALPDTRTALRVLLHGYRGYSAFFIDYLDLIIARAPPALAAELEANKAEEMGAVASEALAAARLVAADVAGVQHTVTVPLL